MVTQAAGGPVVRRRAADIQTFTASGTWTNPGGVTQVVVVLYGGGGGGAASAAACTAWRSKSVGSHGW